MSAEVGRDQAPTAFDVRAEMVATVERLLLGPLLGEDEEITSRPLDTYLTGILWPKNSTISGEEDEQLEGTMDEDDDQPPDQGASLSSMFRPSAIGLTFQIESRSGFRIHVRGGRYTPIVAERQEAKDTVDQEVEGELKWSRTAVDVYIDIPPDFSGETYRTSSFNDADGKSVSNLGLELFIKHRKRDDRLIITVTLINTAEEDAARRNELALFQSLLEIGETPGTPFQIIYRSADPPSREEDVDTNALLYRDAVEYAVGHGIGTDWQEFGGRIVRIHTDWIPHQSVPSVSPSGHPRLVKLAKGDESPFAGAFLSDPARGTEIRRRLTLFCDEYASWIKEQNQELPDLRLSARNMATAKRHLADCELALGRMRKGVAALKGVVLDAFCLANEAMEMQSMFRGRGSDAKPFNWRPFQLAFFLLTIPSLLVAEDTSERERMDLLWFPTGGGKTEAYLALVAFAIFYRRLSDIGSLAEECVTVLMRYTLRLLTVQQFQRASALICACDIIRKRHRTTLGECSISIGLYVGQAATPNRVIGTDDESPSAQRAIDEERKGGSPPSTPRLLLRCPVCGEDLTANDYSIDAASRTMSIRCPNSTCETAGGELPIHTVDDEIYRVKPSLLLGTIDKFAQLPRNERVGALIGCPNGRPPTLIIQDELHLISGPLGTIAGLYETALDALSKRGPRRPKIIGSTATIGRAKAQVRALFDRDVAQFPPPGVHANDSFFAVEDRLIPDRLYLGLSSAGRSPKFTLQALVAATLQGAQYLSRPETDGAALDPFWTCVLYFNSLRELGGAKVLVRDDVGRTVPFYARELDGTARPQEQEPCEITSRVSSRDIPQRLEQLAVSLTSDPNIGLPLDTVLASNMISVGVDVPRLGHMIVAGQPKSTSEYIQATSRVGRGIPGLIWVVYNVSRPRDLSHFEHFKSYHQALYRSVEATSVTPWSPRARDRALHAAFAAIVRNSVPGMQDADAAVNFDRASAYAKDIFESIVQRCMRSSEDVPEHEIRNELEAILSRWGRRTNGSQLSYWAKVNPYTGKHKGPHLMRDMEEVWRDPEVWPTPNSMREVEPSAFFSLWEEDAAKN